MTKRRFLLVGLLATLFTATTHAELIDNPQYTSWAKHKVGTKVTAHTATVMDAGMSIGLDTTQTLMEIAPDKVTIEIVMSLDMGGTKQENKRTQTINAKIESGQEGLPPDATLKGSAKQTGKETITVSGKAYDCTIMEFTGGNARSNVSGKSWMTAEIPGAIAKMEMKVDSPMQGTATMNVTAVDVK